MIRPVPVITIDGPSGSGKGTVAALLAGKLGWNFLDSGALYRLLAFAARNHGVDLTNEEALKVLAEHLDVQFGAVCRVGQADSGPASEPMGRRVPLSHRRPPCPLHARRDVRTLPAREQTHTLAAGLAPGHIHGP